MSQAGSRDNTARKRSTASSGNTGSGRKSAGGIARNRTSASGGKSSSQGAARNSKSSSGKGKSIAKGSNSKIAATKRAANEKEEYEQLTIKDAYVKKKNSMIDELIVGVVLLFSIICFLGVIDKGGIVGKYLKYFLFGTFGIFGYVAPILILLATVVIVYIGKDIPVVKSLLGVLVFVNLLAIIQLAVHYDEKLHFYEYYKYCGENLNGGGFLGALILSMLAPLFGKAAAIVVAIIVIIICLVLITEKAIFRSISISSGKAAKKEVERAVEHHNEVVARKREMRRRREIAERKSGNFMYKITSEDIERAKVEGSGNNKEFVDYLKSGDKEQIAAANAARKNRGFAYAANAANAANVANAANAANATNAANAANVANAANAKNAASAKNPASAASAANARKAQTANVSDSGKNARNVRPAAALEREKDDLSDLSNLTITGDYKKSSPEDTKNINPKAASSSSIADDTLNINGINENAYNKEIDNAVYGDEGYREIRLETGEEDLKENDNYERIYLNGQSAESREYVDDSEGYENSSETEYTYNGNYEDDSEYASDYDEEAKNYEDSDIEDSSIDRDSASDFEGEENFAGNVMRFGDYDNLSSSDESDMGSSDIDVNAYDKEDYDEESNNNKEYYNEEDYNEEDYNEADYDTEALNADNQNLDNLEAKSNAEDYGKDDFDEESFKDEYSSDINTPDDEYEDVSGMDRFAQYEDANSVLAGDSEMASQIDEFSDSVKGQGEAVPGSVTTYKTNPNGTPIGKVSPGVVGAVAATGVAGAAGAAPAIGAAGAATVSGATGAAGLTAAGASIAAMGSILDDSVEPEEVPIEVLDYIVPPLDLLAEPVKGRGADEEELKSTAKLLQDTLKSFGVNVKVTNVSCGPAVTRYEIMPEQGVKVSRITALSDDIKLNLAAADIRIEAPIPGKPAVGIEVPNKENSPVMLRELIENEEFTGHKSNIAFGVGKDIGGKVVIGDIAKMPHLLIAGSTGSGKSVCINSIIMSIIYKADPKDVRMILIDPKVVELSIYNPMPHLLMPVVTDPKEASAALAWAVAEMNNRYKKFAKAGVRDLKGFNQKVEKGVFGDDEQSKLKNKMPHIVIIVDELADLMMVAQKEVEDSIQHITQMARAAGIHLIIATQRPSVNVITGVIKANVPSRIAFAVSSQVDSRTIIDQAGAEKLLGKGDMLFFPSGIPKPIRVQGAFVSDEEVNAVVDYLEEFDQGTAIDLAVQGEIQRLASSSDEEEADAGKGSKGASSQYDDYFIEAGRLLIEKNKASIGMLQRTFSIGFNRAARIMDQLTGVGVVGPEEGTKPRKILMSAEQFEAFAAAIRNQ